MKKIQINRCGKNNRKSNINSKETEKRERKRSLRCRFFLRPRNAEECFLERYLFAPLRGEPVAG